MTNEVSVISEVVQYTTIGQNIVLAICGMATTIIAYCGLSVWRKELKGQAEYDKARDFLKAMYRVRSGFDQVCNPFIYQDEYPAKMIGELGLLKPEFEADGIVHVYEKRWGILTDAFSELEDQSLEAQVEWGDEFIGSIIPLRKCLAELHQKLSGYLAAKKDFKGQEPKTLEQCKENGLVFDIDRDCFISSVYSAVDHIESKLRPFIKNK
jgi:hypothetical protein